MPIQPQQPQPPQPGQVPPRQYPAMSVSEQRSHKPWILIGALVFFIIAFFSAVGFGFWAYAQATDYKTNVDEKIAAAKAVQKKETEDTKEREFLERNKSPYKIYKGPATYGAIEITYPKTWSATVDTKAQSGTPVVGYFHPDYVPGIKSGTAFALKAEVLERPYAEVMKQYDGAVRRGLVKVEPFELKRVPSVLGAKARGETESGYQGTAVILPLRDKSIRISTLSTQSFIKDFDKIIESFIFTP
jgi:hypothetical protein